MKIISSKSINRITLSDTTIPDIKLFNKMVKIIENILKLHSNSHMNQKSNILSIVAYKSLRNMLKISGFKFSDSQFTISRNRRKDDKISLNNYIRSMPYIKRKISKNVIIKICEYLEKYSRQSPREETIKYLDKSKKEIYRSYINDNNPQISYAAFIKNCPKNFKIGKKWTDVCPICELSKKY